MAAKRTAQRKIKPSIGRNARSNVVVLPLDLASAIDGRVGARKRRQFIIESCVRELGRLEQMEAIRESAGAWRREAHPELEENSVEWQERMRPLWDRREARAARKR